MRLNWCLSNIDVIKLHKTEVDVPPNLHEVDVEDLKLGRDESEVDELQQWPHFQIGGESRPQFLTKLIFSALEGLALALRSEDVEAGNGHQAEEGLSKQQFLGHWRHRVSRGEDWHKLRVGVVKGWTVGKETVGHEVNRADVIIVFLRFEVCYTNYS